SPTRRRADARRRPPREGEVSMETSPVDRANDLLDQGRPNEAAEILRTLINENRAGLMARLLFARALIASGDIASALETARDTSTLYPAIAEFHRALRIDPSLDDARLKLAQAWLEAGEPAKALEALDASEDHPDRD